MMSENNNFLKKQQHQTNKQPPPPKQNKKHPTTTPLPAAHKNNSKLQIKNPVAGSLIGIDLRLTVYHLRMEWMEMFI